MITKEDAARRLHGGEYRREGSCELFAQMKVAGLVAVFGASDDLIEFRGAIHDEVGAWDGVTAYVTPDGLLQNKCANERCPYHAKEKERAAPIDAVWDSEGFSWIYKTEIPHATFTILEESEPYCRGIVFALADVSPAPATNGRPDHE